MIKVLLADDDFLIKDVLQTAVPWKELGMQIIGFAEDGKQALDLCLEHKPDILITDIKMPFLSGLEVALHLAEEKAATKVILISGIQDFEYARTALDIRASGYLLKPISMNEVIATLKKVREEIEVESNREQVIENIQKRLEENLPLAQELFLCNLVVGETVDQDEIAEKLKYFSLPFSSSEELFVAVAEIDNYNTEISSKTIRETQLLNFMVRDIIDQTLENYGAGICVSPQDNRFACLMHSDNCSYMDPIFESISELAEKLASVTLSFGIGLPVKDVRNAYVSYRSAIKALDYKFYTGNRSIIRSDDISSIGFHSTATSEEYTAALHHLRGKILRFNKLGDTQSMTVCLDEYFDKLKSFGLLTQQYVRGQFLEIVIHSFRIFYEIEGDMPEISEHYNSAIQHIIKAETIDEVKKHTKDILEYTSTHFSSKYTSRNQSVVETIKDYIKQNHMGRISLDDIANTVFMSANYICSIFKKETGQTISEYILGLKMEQAKKMLLDTNMKIMEIAWALGYETAHYFSYSFKRSIGKTPQQYRKENIVVR